MAATAKVIELKGDPQHPESAEHIIKFPGGSISVCRTNDREYWAHIEVNHGQHGPEVGGVREEARGDVVDSRVDYSHGGGVQALPDEHNVQHIAIRIAIQR